ncbi:hypothetical protein [Xenorhabdus miraniensis]|uniref:Membrane protein n=1 Tax=Xenorhabdus miraniensis TaxID=351674 RepID=A0A2D0JU75_9GAMM|nr:hypothetical protein [Xenorhabdus miraniensis]PHM49900.1 membrane protein [Xenorhabdus miraniensis]
MTRRKNYNPTWDGYLGDYLNGEIGINQLKPQHEFFDSIGLEKVLSDNTQYHYVLTLAQAQSIIEDINLGPPRNPSYAEDFARGTEVERKKENPAWSLFSITDPISTYAGNIYDSFGFSDVCREFKRLSITAKTYVGENGKKYIHLSGHAGLRRLVRGTRYGASHPQMLAMGIGQQGLNTSIVEGVRFCIIFSIGYRIIESIFKDEYTLADFIGNITVDMAKTAIVAAASWAVGSFLTATAVLGGSVIVVAGIVLLAGILITIGLDFVDKKYGISEKLIELLKEKMKRKPRTQEANLQYFFNTMGKIR